MGALEPHHAWRVAPKPVLHTCEVTRLLKDSMSIIAVGVLESGVAIDTLTAAAEIVILPKSK